jgi:hypothetical protein
MQGQYALVHLTLAHGKICLGEDVGWQQLEGEQGAPKAAQHKIPWMIQLQKITLKDMEVVYGSKQQRYSVSAAYMQASLRKKDTKLEADLQGKVTMQCVQPKDVSLAQSLPISLKASLSYDQRQKSWTVQDAQLRHGKALLAVQGSGCLPTTSSMALTIQGKKINSQSLLRCLPKQYYQKIQPYNLQGEITLHVNVNKQPNKSFALQGGFTLSDGALTASQLSNPIALPQLSGHLSIPNVRDLTTATLSIDKMTSTLAGSKLSGSLVLRDFHKLHLQCAAKATLDLASLSMLLAYPAITEASGQLGIHWNLEANLQQLIRGAHAKHNFLLSGALQVQETAQFKLGLSQLLCKDLIGNLVFQDNVLVMKDFSGSIGSGSFSLEGTVQNLLPYMLFNNQKDQKLYVDAKLYMDYLDLDTVRYGKHTSTALTSSNLPKFDIAPQWELNLDCDFQQLHFRRFQGKNVRGKVKVKDQKLITEKLQLGVLGGKVFLDGVVDTSTDHLNIHTVAKLKGVQIAKLFYTFENFHQNFLMDSHLSGEVFSDVVLTMQADKQWNMHWDVLQAAINFRLSDGVLYDFKPMQQLAKYVDKESLRNLRFSAIKNSIFIKDQTIHFPPMEVYSSLTRIQLSGTHTFDGQVAYLFGVPFTGLRQKESGGILEEVASDASKDVNVFFKLQGDIDNYKISYDAKASQESLKKALKGQGKVLSAIARGAYSEKEPLQELAPDDYFELDE